MKVVKKDKIGDLDNAMNVLKENEVLVDSKNPFFLFAICNVRYFGV